MARGDLQRGLPVASPATARACAGCSASSRSRAGSRATSRPRRRARSTRAASSATRSRTRTARPSTTRSCSCAASSATARRRPGRWRRAGTRTSSSTRRATAPSCRSSTSTATRSPTPRCSPASRATSSTALMEGYGHQPYFVEGDDPAEVHQQLAATLDAVVAEIREIQRRAREDGVTERPRWPMIVLRTPKGWTGPAVDRRPPGRGHLARPPGPDERGPHERGPPRRSSNRGCARYRPEELFDEDGALRAELAALAPTGTRRMSANPVANGGELLRDLDLPDFRDYAVDVPAPGCHDRRGDARPRHVAARRHGPNTRDVPAVRAGRDRVEPARRRPRGHRPHVDGRDDPGRRPPRAGRSRDGGALGAPVPGLARGLPAHRPPRPVQLLRGVHPHRRLDVQPAREVAQGHPRPAVAATDRVAQLPAVDRSSGARTTTASATRTRASSTTWSTRRPTSSGSTCRPTRTRCSRSRDHCLRSRHYVNVIVAGQAAGAQLAVDGRGDHPLHPRDRDLGLREQRRGRRARRRHGLRRRHPDARGAGRGRPAPPAPARSVASGSSTSST